MNPRRRNTRPDPTKNSLLSGAWRAVLLILGIALVAGGVAMWLWPVQHDEFAPQAPNATGVAKVDAPSEALSSAMVAIGALLVLVAANGRKFTSVKVGDYEVAFSAATSDVAGKKAKKKAKDEGLNDTQAKEAEAIARSEAFVEARRDPYRVDPDAIATRAVEAAKTIT